MSGDPSAFSTLHLTSALYEHLRGLAAVFLSKEHEACTLQPTALVSEAFIRIADQRRGSGEGAWQSKEQFLGVVATCMRRAVIDHARTRLRLKRGRGMARVQLDESVLVAQEDGVDLIELDESLARFRSRYPRQARVVELRVFAGLEFEMIATLLSISVTQVKRDWAFARAWLKNAMTHGEPSDAAPERES